MKNIFDAVALNNLRVKNRPVRSATWEGIAAPDGSIGDDTYEIYRELAKGGVGAIVTGFTSVATNDFYFGGMMRLSDNKLIPQYKRLVEVIHAEDCAAISQLALGAFYKNRSEVGENDMTTQEVRDVIKMFVDAAARGFRRRADSRGAFLFPQQIHQPVRQLSHGRIRQLDAGARKNFNRHPARH